MTSPVSIPAGHKLTAADFDAYENLTGVWTSYSPAWTASGTAPAIGNGTITGRYIQVGKLVIYAITWTAGSSTTFGTGNWSFSTPTSRAASVTEAVSATLRDTGSSQAYTGGGRHSAATVRLNSASGLVTSTVPFTWADSDFINLLGVYEAA